MRDTHALFASVLAVAFAAAAAAQTSTKPAAPAEDLPDAPAATAAALVQPNGPTVLFDTSMGRITCQFYERQAPKTVANFIALAEGTKDWVDPKTSKKQHNKPLYDGTIFHRVIPDFMIQGGDPAGTGMGDPGYAFEDEFDPNLNFDVPGRLAMANSGPNTNGSQFFITEVATEHLNQKHTIFGQCTEPSVLVVGTIARVKTGENDMPVSPVVLKKVTIVREGQPMPPKPGEAAPAAAAERPSAQHGLGISISPGVAAGLLDQKRAPLYPIEAKKAGVSGTVILEATISEAGMVENLHIISGPEPLQQAAMDAVKEWRYRPYLLNGQPVEVKTRINVIFTLGN
jgi:peptidyl-prolyl cis-trans isomerase A (cyclophilin A)